MKIIKRGNIPSEGETKWTCRNCTSVIKSKKSEGRLVYDQRDGDYVKCVCPVCNHENCIGVGLYR